MDWNKVWYRTLTNCFTVLIVFPMFASLFDDGLVSWYSGLMIALLVFIMQTALEWWSSKQERP